MPHAASTPTLLARLRDEIRRIERRPARRGGALGCGLDPIDALLPGGFPCGALTELRGGPASGKTAVALSLFARLGPRDLCAFVDGRGELYPPAAAALGVDLGRLLIVRPPAGEEGARLTLWAAEALLGSGAFAAVAVDPPALRPFRGSDVALRRLVTAAEQGGAAGLWLSPLGAALRPPAPIRLELRRDHGRLTARHAERQGPGERPEAPARAGGVHAA